MVGMRPLGLSAVYHGSFCVFLPMWMACHVYCSPYASLSSSSRIDALKPLGVPGASGQRVSRWRKVACLLLSWGQGDGETGTKRVSVVVDGLRHVGVHTPSEKLDARLGNEPGWFGHSGGGGSY